MDIRVKRAYEAERSDGYKDTTSTWTSYRARGRNGRYGRLGVWRFHAARPTYRSARLVCVTGHSDERPKTIQFSHEEIERR